MDRVNHDIRGKVEIVLKNKYGKIIQRSVVHNDIVNSGRMVIAEFFKGAAKWLKVGVGKSPDKVEASQGIENRQFLEPLTVIKKFDDPEVKDNRAKLRFSSTFADGISGDLAEAGIIFSEDENSNMIEEKDILYNVVTFTKIEKLEDDEITFNWEITF